MFTIRKWRLSISIDVCFVKLIIHQLIVSDYKFAYRVTFTFVTVALNILTIYAIYGFHCKCSMMKTTYTASMTLK